MKILEAIWVWTEPHSKRLRVCVDVEKSVLDGKVDLRQRVEIVYIVINRQCSECIRDASDHSWGAVIQLRQRVSSAQALSRGLAHIENELWKASLHNLMLGVETVKNGLDMFFKHKNQAEKVVNFLLSRLPVRVKISKKMVSADRKSNTQKYEHAYLVDVAPLAKHDLVLLPRESGRGSDIMVVSKVSSSLRLVSPLTLRRVDLTASKYFSSPFSALLNPAQLVSFVVLDVHIVSAQEVQPVPAKGPRRQKLSRHSKSVKKSTPTPVGSVMGAVAPDSSLGGPAEGIQGEATVRTQGGLLAEVEVARESDLGTNDTTYRVMTHLGHILSAGDIVLGFDLSHSTLAALEGVGEGGELTVTDSDRHAHAIISQEIVLIRKEVDERGMSREAGVVGFADEKEDDEDEDEVNPLFDATSHPFDPPTSEHDELGTELSTV